MDALTSTILEYRYYIEALAVVIAVLTAISSVDDVFVDLYYWRLKIFGHQDAKDKAFARAVAAAGKIPERPFAIMVPAWKEYDVIFSMVATNSRLLAYKNYHYFIGVYRNDQRTIDEVRRAQVIYANVHMVVVPRDGPTSKADCLNEVLAQILDFELDSGVGFAGIALHDSEDFIHPHELQVFNSLVGKFDFIQLPVFSFSQPLHDMVGGIYMDEFAEVHTKDLTVRKHLSGLIPCAGVSACFGRDAVAQLAGSNDGEVFRTSCFTEDYDIAFRLRALGLRSTFVSCPVNYTIDITNNSVMPAFVQRTLPIATREFFPSELRGAYRQRARWLIGIVFQGMSSHGWSGNWGTKYFLARDRKGIVTSPSVMLGYFVLANLVLIELFLTWFGNGKFADYVLLSQDYVMDLFFLNLIFLLWRLAHRIIFTTRIYNLRHGLMAAPRLIVSNFVNFFAAVRAVRIYSGHLITGKPLVWDKTAHSYPFEFGQSVSAVPVARPVADPVGRQPVWAPANAVPAFHARQAMPPERRTGLLTQMRLQPISLVLITTLLVVLDLSPSASERARAQSSVTSSSADKDDASIRAAVAADPAAEQPVRALVDALSNAGRKREALAEADRFAARATATAALRAQRGFLRRELGDTSGAAEDFTAALAGSELAADQRRNVEAGLAEAQSADAQRQLDAAQNALTQGDFSRAADAARAVLERDPKSEAAARIRVEALTRAGRKREALTELDQLIARGMTGSAFRAQRGFLRREFKDPNGAAEDFAAALAGEGLTTEQRRNIETGLAEARTAELQGDLDRAQPALQQRNYTAAIEATRVVLERNPNSEPAMRIRAEALARAGRKRDALAELEKFERRGALSAALRAQRGYLRRELRDLEGAIDDFAAALASDGLSAEQRRSLNAALREARSAVGQGDLELAQSTLTRGDTTRAAELAANILQREPGSEAAMRIRIDALTRAGRKTEAEAAASQLIARGRAQGWVYASRGFTRRDTGDFGGAVQDFDAALARGDLDAASVPNVRYARAEAAAMLAERNGKPQAAEAAYRDFLAVEPTQADGWFKLGYLLLQQGRREQGADALKQGLGVRPVGRAYLDAAGAYIFTNAPLASQLYRQGLDRWYAGDPSFAGASSTDLERVRNEVVEADASIRSAISYGGIAARPEAAGGRQSLAAAETRVRFDGRYLGAVPGLEAFARGLSGKEATGETETDAGVGLRFRPIRDLNLYVGGLVDYFFTPKARTELVMIWGLGLGANPYPYETGWKPYWDFGTFGAWRTVEGRLLEDTRGNIGALYEFRAPVRGAVGPTILAVAGYDSLAPNQWAAGIGPSVLSYFWLGGDKYRSYDAIASFQLGYLVNVGNDARQRGWRGQIGVAF